MNHFNTRRSIDCQLNWVNGFVSIAAEIENFRSERITLFLFRFECFNFMQAPLLLSFSLCHAYAHAMHTFHALFIDAFYCLFGMDAKIKLENTMHVIIHSWLNALRERNPSRNCRMCSSDSDVTARSIEWIRWIPNMNRHSMSNCITIILWAIEWQRYVTHDTLGNCLHVSHLDN